MPTIGGDPELIPGVARAKSNKGEPAWSPAQDLWGSLFGLVAVGIFLLCFGYGPAVLKWASQVDSNKIHLRLFYLVLIFIGSFGMYRFRRAQQSYFGITECAFAVAAGWKAIGTLDGSMPKDWLPLFAAAYVFVRGLTNYHDGKLRK